MVAQKKIHETFAAVNLETCEVDSDCEELPDMLQTKFYFVIYSNQLNMRKPQYLVSSWWQEPSDSKCLYKLLFSAFIKINFMWSI
jgi:hypothetical protein